MARNNRKADKGGLVWIVASVFTVCVIALAYLYLETNQDKTARQLAQQRKRLHEAGVRNNNLQAQLEEKTQSTYIFRKVREFNLPLQSPNPLYVMEINYMDDGMTVKPVEREGELAVTALQP